MAACSSGSKAARRGARSNMGGHPSSGVAGKAGAYSSRDPQSLGRPDPCSLPLVAGRRFGSPLLGTEEHQSEEHTSELQSLMRKSYAVFCLKKITTAKIVSTHMLYTQ